MAQAVAQTISNDPVAEAGRLLAQLVKQFNAADATRMQCTDGARRNQLKEQMDVIQDRIATAEGVVMQGQATTMQGAMAQVLIAMADADSIHTFVGEECRPACEAYARRIDSALYSVLGLLSQTCGTDPAELAGAYYARPDANPHMACTCTLAA